MTDWIGKWKGGRTYRVSGDEVAYCLEKMRKGRRFALRLDARNDEEAERDLALFDRDPVGFVANKAMESRNRINAFVADRCVREHGASVEPRTLGEAWGDWCRARGHRIDAELFCRAFEEAIPEIHLTRGRTDGGGRARFHVYEGIRLRTADEKPGVAPSLVGAPIEVRFRAAFDTASALLLKGASDEVRNLCEVVITLLDPIVDPVSADESTDEPEPSEDLFQ